jgi:hypothetical protein
MPCGIARLRLAWRRRERANTVVKPWLVGKDQLEIDTLYTTMGERTRDLSGREQMDPAQPDARRERIEMALWDLAGKILEVPTSTLSAESSATSARLRSPHRATCWTKRRLPVGSEGEGIPVGSRHKFDFQQRSRD